jgi:hypothetical protein
MPPITDPASLAQIQEQQRRQGVTLAGPAMIAPAPPPESPPGYYPANGGGNTVPRMSLPPRQQQLANQDAARLALSRQAEGRISAHEAQTLQIAQHADARAQEDHAAQDAILFDPATTDFYARTMLAGGQMPSTGFGGGKVAATNKQKVMKRMAEMAGQLGVSGADFATQQVHYKAATKKLQTLETMAGAIGVNEDTAIKNGEQFLEASERLPGQTQLPGMNSAVQFAQRHLNAPGHDEVAAMDTAMNTFLTEYAKVVAGSPTGAGVLSDSSRHEQQEIMRGNYPISMKRAAFEQMKKDMNNRIVAIDAGIKNAYADLTHIPNSTTELKLPDPNAGTSKNVSTTHKTIPVPEGYQEGIAAFMRKYPPGHLTVEDYTKLRQNLDKEFLPPNQASHLDPAEVQKYVEDYNKGHGSVKIPDINVPLSEKRHIVAPIPFTSEKERAEFAASPAGTGVSAAADAYTLGAVDLLGGQEFRDKRHSQAELNPMSDMAGDLVGSIGGLRLVEKGTSKALTKAAEKLDPTLAEKLGGKLDLSKLTPSARQKLLGDVAVNAEYGGIRGFNDANDGEGGSGALGGATAGAIGAGAGNFATKGLKPLVSDKTAAALEQLKGVKLTTLQKLGLGPAERVTAGIPFAHGVQERALKSYNIDTANRALAPIGEKVAKGITPGTELNAHVNQKLNAAYNAIRPQIVGSVDKTFKLAQEATKAISSSTSDKKEMYKDISNAMKGFTDENGHYTGEGYKAASERLRYLSKLWSNRAEVQGDVAAGDMARAAEQTRKQIQQLVQRQTPEVGARLKNIERGWAMSVLNEDASNRAMARSEGLFTPSDRLASTKKLDTSARQGATARGRGLDQPYTLASQRIIGSGAAPKLSARETVYALAAVSAGHVPGAGPSAGAVSSAIAAIGAGLYMPGLRTVVQKVLLGRPATVEESKLLRRAVSSYTRHAQTGN